MINIEDGKVNSKMQPTVLAGPRPSTAFWSRTLLVKIACQCIVSANGRQHLQHFQLRRHNFPAEITSLRCRCLPYKACFSHVYPLKRQTVFEIITNTGWALYANLKIQAKRGETKLAVAGVNLNAPTLFRYVGT